jgi:hypothetical protein
VNIWSRRVHWQPPWFFGMSGVSVYVGAQEGKGDDVRGIE